MRHKTGILLTLIFIVLAALTTRFLWIDFPGLVGIQVLIILAVAFFGEHYVSGKGYYYYADSNAPFAGRVPLWIPFMWIFAIQSSILLSIWLGFHGVSAAAASGIIGLTADLLIIEPYLCKGKQLWRWITVENGYFAFIPPGLNRFTAPLGNYVVWFAFPFSMTLLLVMLRFASSVFVLG